MGAFYLDLLVLFFLAVLVFNEFFAADFLFALAFAEVCLEARLVVFEDEHAFVLLVDLFDVLLEQALVFEVVLQLLFEPPQFLLLEFVVFIFSPFCSTIIVCIFRQNMQGQIKNMQKNINAVKLRIYKNKLDYFY